MHSGLRWKSISASGWPQNISCWNTPVLHFSQPSLTFPILLFAYSNSWWYGNIYPDGVTKLPKKKAPTSNSPTLGSPCTPAPLLCTAPTDRGLRNACARQAVTHRSKQPHGRWAMCPGGSRTYTKATTNETPRPGAWIHYCRRVRFLWDQGIWSIGLMGHTLVVVGEHSTSPGWCLTITGILS